MSSDDLVIKKIFKCSKRELFDAWSVPSIMAKWFFAKPKYKNSTVESSFNVNGKYSVTMHFVDQDVHTHGEYKTITRYSLIEFTWTSPAATDSLVRLEFKELSPNRSELVLTHFLLPSEESKRMHGMGWEMCLENLAMFGLEEQSENTV